MTLEMGKPPAEARGELTHGAEFLRWFAEVTVRDYIDAVVAGCDGLHGRCNLEFGGDVRRDEGADRTKFSFQFGLERLAGFSIDIAQAQPGAFLGKSPGTRPPDPRCGTGDDDGFTAKIEFHSHPTSRGYASSLPAGRIDGLAQEEHSLSEREQTPDRIGLTGERWAVALGFAGAVPGSLSVIVPR